MKSRRCSRGAVVAALVVLVALLTACGGSKGSASSTPKDSVTFGEFVSITSLDPAKIAGYSVGGTEGAAVYGELMRLDSASGAYVPYLAKGLTHSADYLEWTLTLRPGVTFTDGTPLDANAVVTNFKRNLDPTHHATVAGLLDGFVASVSPVNSTTVSFRLKQPWTGFAYVLSATAGMIAAPSYLAKVDAGDANATPVGAGPFKVSSFRASEELTLVRNDHYFAGAPKLRTLKFVFVPGGVPTLQAFDNGQLQAALLYDAQAIQQAKQEHVPSRVIQAPLGSVVLINNRAGSPGHDPRIRQALSLAISQRLYNTRVYRGAGSSSSQLFARGSRWYEPSMAGVRYDPAKAKRLVRKVEADTGWNGSLRFVCGNEPDRVAVPTALQAMLQPIGIKLQVTNDIPTSQVINQVIVKQDFDLSCWGYGVQDSDPFPGIWLQLSRTSTNNFSGYSNDQMESALGALQTATGAPAEKAALGKLNEAWNDTWPSVNLGTAQYANIYQPDLHGVTFTIGPVALFDRAWLG